MKYLLLILLTCQINFLFSQVPERQILKGKINVPSDAEAKNISVYNINTKKGTTTNAYGEFLLKVKNKDHVLISSVQFQNFEIEITENIMKERDIVIQIKENVNQLNEVTVTSNLLSGNLNVDIKKIETDETNLNIDQKELISGYDADITIDSQIRSNNVAIDDEYLDYGMDFVKIFKRYIKKKPDSKKDQVIENIDVEIRKMYDNAFFKEYFDIDENQINAFIFYADEHGLTSELLKKGNEMDLLQFLLDKSKEFNNPSVKMD
ncbi:MAG: hypothetical protein GVY05_04235 [Bacteroidetes bacterium]|jgi:hypothetical protein|nr:hypothetical protein [Bacteroidota bacterium]